MNVWANKTKDQARNINNYICCDSLGSPIEYLSNHNSLRPKLVLGFAAETNDLLKNAQEKILTKHCDWIIANDISKAEIGFGSDFNEVSIVYKEKNKQNETISKRKKSEIAEIITDKVVENFIS
jgi:phosphopantothenoylcysteine decarboxylase/phosphopantothenate--cysteine ligase